MAKATDAPRSEHRWPVLLITLAALSLHLLLPDSITLLPQWVVPVIGLIVVTPLVLINPRRLTRETRWSRWLGIAFALGLTAVNQVYVVQIVMELINDNADGPIILLSTLAVWITNAVAFALIYWQLDLGGPVQRRVQGRADDAIQDFRFPQQDNREGQEDWYPEFLDYAYFSLSNMMAFSPTDVMPLSRRAKLLMAYQAFTGFVLLALVIARSVNILTP
jgi:uncharacterized membrane protein